MYMRRGLLYIVYQGNVNTASSELTAQPQKPRPWATRPG